MYLNILKRIFHIAFLYIKYFKFYKILKKKHYKFSTKFLKQLQKSGPSFIKIGQILGTRIDIFPKKILNTLNKLYNAVYPIKSKIIKNIFLIKTKRNNYTKISNIPIATASISQIYIIYIKNKKFVIKILNTNSKKQVLTDLKILLIIKKLINLILPLNKVIKLKQIINEIINTLKIEQNLQIEAINIEKQKKTLNTTPYIIPNVFKTPMKKNILITEFIKGIPLYKLNLLKKTKYIKKEIIIENYVKIFCLQVFKHGLFHADMHPGNILLNYNKNTKSFNLALIDFGIIGNLKNNEKVFILKNVLAFIEKDYKTIIQLHKNEKNKKILKNMENDLYCLLDPITNKKLEEISFKKIIKNLFIIVKKYNIEFKPQFLLFQKTLLTVEGVCRTLNKKINLWNIIKTTLKNNLKK